MSKTKPIGPEAEEALRTSPVPWFALLERARLAGDAALERTAREQLSRLGVTVSYVSGSAGGSGSAATESRS